MHSLDAFAQAKLDALDRSNLRRSLSQTLREDELWIERDGRRLLSFSCNDYLNLSQHPAIKAAVIAALYDDLNAPIALGALFTFIRKANAELDRSGVDRRALERAREVFSKINSVLDVVPEAAGPDPELAQWVEGKLSARKDARARKEFAQADAIRAEIEGRGIAIEDGAQGTKWKKLR